MFNSNSSYPSFSAGSLSLNGKEKAKTYQNGGKIVSNFNLSEFEDTALKYVQESLAKHMPQINTFSPEVLKGFDSQIETFKNNAIKEIDNVYLPMLNSLKNDIASRFGSFSNSVFLNNLNNIEDKRSDAISALAQDINLKRDALQDAELARRYKFLNFLSDYQNNFYDNMLNTITATQKNSQLGNAYNQNAYNAQNANYLYNQKLQSDVNDYTTKVLLPTLLKAFL